MDRQSRAAFWIGALVAVLVAVGIGVLAYQAGVSHGLALQLPAAGAAAAGPFYPPYYWYRPWGFGLFGPVFFIVFWVVLLRAMFWRSRARWHRSYCTDGPSPFDDWHRRAHERMNATPTTNL